LLGLIADRRLLPLIPGCWSLITGCWWLVADRCLLVAGR
jgi:hypothetical protein